MSKEVVNKWPFLKRRPRIFTAGDPNVLGFILPSKEMFGSETKEDKYGINWHDALFVVSSMIFTNEDIPFGLRSDWFGNTLYNFESPDRGYLSEQGYIEFNNLVEEAKKTSIPTKLFTYSKPIDTYAIPKLGSDRRFEFNRYAKTILKHYLWLQEYKNKVQQAVKELVKKIE